MALRSKFSSSAISSFFVSRPISDAIRSLPSVVPFNKVFRTVMKYFSAFRSFPLASTGIFVGGSNILLTCMFCTSFIPSRPCSSLLTDGKVWLEWLPIVSLSVADNMNSSRKDQISKFISLAALLHEILIFIPVYPGSSAVRQFLELFSSLGDQVFLVTRSGCHSCFSLTEFFPAAQFYFALPKNSA